MEIQASMKIESLPNHIISKILIYTPLEDIFVSLQYTSHSFKRHCQQYTIPKIIDLNKLQFLNTKQKCQLIKSTDVTHFRGLYPFGTVDSVIFEYLSTHAKSLKTVSLTCYTIENGDSLLLLIHGSNNFVELKLDTVALPGLNNFLNQCTDLTNLPPLRKIALLDIPDLEAETVIKLVNLCPNLVDVSIKMEHFAPMKKVILHIIRKIGHQLKHLRYYVYLVDESLVELSKCTQLETLYLDAIWVSGHPFRMPYMANLKKLTLTRMDDSTETNISYSLESFPNLVELTIKYDEYINMATVRGLLGLCNLRKIYIDSPLRKNIVSFIFSNCKNLKYAAIVLADLFGMSSDEITTYCGRLHTLDLIDTEGIKDAAKILANLLPYTKVHRYIFCQTELKRIRVWPDQCSF